MNQRQKGLQAVLECLRLLHRTPAENERREAARGLGLEDWLPEPTQQEMELKED